MSEIDEANEVLLSKGYREAQLAVHATPMASKALLKGTKIGSPFSDSPETVLRAVRDCIPPAGDLGRRTLTPRELRACLEDSTHA
jgi:hypothetical protein